MSVTLASPEFEGLTPSAVSLGQAAKGSRFLRGVSAFSVGQSKSVSADQVLLRIAAVDRRDFTISFRAWAVMLYSSRESLSLSFLAGAAELEPHAAKQ